MKRQGLSPLWSCLIKVAHTTIAFWQHTSKCTGSSDWFKKLGESGWLIMVKKNLEKFNKINQALPL